VKIKAIIYNAFVSSFKNIYRPLKEPIFKYFAITKSIEYSFMGLVYADIELINGGDLEMVRRNMMDKDEVKMMIVSFLVDSGDTISVPMKSFKYSYSYLRLNEEKNYFVCKS
jgi:hypothetical protein